MKQQLLFSIIGSLLCMNALAASDEAAVLDHYASGRPIARAGFQSR